MVNAAPETGRAAAPTARESFSLIVAQPKRLEGLLDGINKMVSEEGAKGPAHDGAMTASGAGGAATSQQGTSARDQAIASIPAPMVVQNKLAQHIQNEVRMLRREAGKVTRLSHPGAAYKLTLIYARIRRLNALLTELWDASYEVLKRLFIRVFIDRQPIL